MRLIIILNANNKHSKLNKQAFKPHNMKYSLQQINKDNTVSGAAGQPQFFLEEPAETESASTPSTNQINNNNHNQTPKPQTED